MLGLKRIKGQFQPQDVLILARLRSLWRIQARTSFARHPIMLILLWLTGIFSLFLSFSVDYQSDVEARQRRHLAGQIIEQISQGDYSALHQPYRQVETPSTKLNEGGTNFLPILDHYFFMNEEVDLDARFAPYGFSSDYCSIHVIGSNGRQLHAVFKIDQVKDDLILKEISVY